MENWSSEKTFYCAGLLSPQSVTEHIHRARDFYALKGLIPGQLEPFVPIWIGQNPPVEPVPGLLPKCNQPLRIGPSLSISSNRDWIIWPVESFGWFDLLQESFSVQGDTGLNRQFKPLPLCAGIPVSPLWPDAGHANHGGEFDIPPNPLSWHAMNIVCYEIEPGDREPWFLGFYWRQLWKRRLKRAP